MLRCTIKKRGPVLRYVHACLPACLRACVRAWVGVWVCVLLRLPFSPWKGDPKKPAHVPGVPISPRQLEDTCALAELCEELEVESLQLVVRQRVLREPFRS